MADFSINLHIHTQFSDGSYLPEEILKYIFASQSNLKILGFSDHFMAMKPSLYTPAQIQRYLEKIQSLRSVYPQFHLLTGAELDIQSFDINHVNLIDSFDYLNIEYLRNLTDFNKLKKIRQRYSRPIFLVHILFTDQDLKIPEAFKIKTKHYSNLLQTMKELNIGLELTDGTRNYLPDENQIPYPYFYYYQDLLHEISQSLLPISIGTDMHHNLEELDFTGQALNCISACNLQTNYALTLQLLKKNVTYP